MRQRLLLIFLTLLSIACSAETEKDLATLQKEFTTLARESHLYTVKNYCVNFWIEPGRRDALSKFASVAEMCECVQSDMKFTVSDALAEKLFQMQIDHQVSQTNKQLSEAETLSVMKEWMSRYSAAEVSCKERFVRRRN